MCSEPTGLREMCSLMAALRALKIAKNGMQFAFAGCQRFLFVLLPYLVDD